MYQPDGVHIFEKRLIGIFFEQAAKVFGGYG